VIRTLALLGAIVPGLALAHHPTGGMTPETLWHGLASGVAHPIIGLDHLAFIVGMALLALLTSAPRVMPVAFVAMTVAGAGLHLAAVNLPIAESVIAASVLLVGVLAIVRVSLPVLAALALFAAGGLFHGYAYAESIIGAEKTPLVAYLVGFAGVQLTIAWALQICAERSLRMADWIRIGGGIAAGVGATFLVV
jgi:urease accessory protein